MSIRCLAAAASAASMFLLTNLPTGADATADGVTSPERVLCSDSAFAVAVADRGRILVGASTYTNAAIHEPDGDHGHVGDFSVLRYTARGALDRRFGDAGHADLDVGEFDDLAEVAPDARGRVVGAGSTRNAVADALGPFDVVVWRHRRDGHLDRGFGDHGKARVDLGGSERAEAVAVDRHGRILVAGRVENPTRPRGLVLRFTADGKLDDDFGRGGRFVSRKAVAFDDVHVDRRGRITVGGRAVLDGNAAVTVTRLSDHGTLSVRFGQRGSALVRWPNAKVGATGAMALDRDGRVLAAIAVTTESAGQIGIVRLTRTGRLDRRWGNHGRAVVNLPQASDWVGALAANRSGEVVLSGHAYPPDFATGDGYLAKLGRRGRLARGFGVDGLVRESFGLDLSGLHGMAIQPDGRIVAAGWNFAEGVRLPESDVAVVRYLPDGRRDRSFGRNGQVLTDIQGAPRCERHAEE